ncbi:hypothetical protein OC835_001305 [Tilletia horrida]|nr:hypothetical protein OC835_001305 [Tilletia horrida]
MQHPDCFFELSGSYSLGSRILYYACILASLLLAAWRKQVRKNARKAKLSGHPLPRRSRKHRLDIALAFAASTTMIIFAVAITHLFVMGIVGFSFPEYRYVTDLDVYAARRFSAIGIFTIWALWPLWPYDISPKQAVFLASIVFLICPIFFCIGTTGGIRPPTPVSSKSCKDRTAHLRHNSAPFEYYEAIVISTPGVASSCFLVGILAFLVEVLLPKMRRTLQVRWLKAGLWFVFGLLWLGSIVDTELHFTKTPFGEHSEPLGSIGQWGALLNAFLASYGYLIFVQLGEGEEEPKKAPGSTPPGQSTVPTSKADLDETPAAATSQTGTMTSIPCSRPLPPLPTEGDVEGQEQVAAADDDDDDDDDGPERPDVLAALNRALQVVRASVRIQHHLHHRLPAHDDDAEKQGRQHDHSQDVDGHEHEHEHEHHISRLNWVRDRISSIHSIYTAPTILHVHSQPYSHAHPPDTRPVAAQNRRPQSCADVGGQRDEHYLRHQQVPHSAPLPSVQYPWSAPPLPGARGSHTPPPERGAARPSTPPAPSASCPPILLAHHRFDSSGTMSTLVGTPAEEKDSPGPHAGQKV